MAIPLVGLNAPRSLLVSSQVHVGAVKTRVGTEDTRGAVMVIRHGRRRPWPCVNCAVGHPWQIRRHPYQASWLSLVGGRAPGEHMARRSGNPDARRAGVDGDDGDIAGKRGALSHPPGVRAVGDAGTKVA